MSSVFDEPKTNYETAPGWLKAADAHGIASGDDSIFDETPAPLAERAADFVQVSLMSAANSFYNSGVAVGNIFTSEDAKTPYRDTADFIASKDENLAEYYKANQESADIAGFIAGSLLPGGVAIKGLGVAQKAAAAYELGNFGSTLSRATGLLVPRMALAVEKQGAELAARNGVWKLFDAGNIKAIAAGAHQGILEGVAFEAATMATMFKSPIFDDQTAGDMIKGSISNAFLFGGFGAIGGLAKSYTGVSKLLKNADARQLELATTASSSALGDMAHSDSIIAAAFDKEGFSKTPITEASILEKKLKQGESGYSITPEAVAEEARFLNSQREQNITKLQNNITRGIFNLNKSPASAKDSKDAFSRLVTDLFGNLGYDDSEDRKSVV